VDRRVWRWWEGEGASTHGEACGRRWRWRRRRDMPTGPVRCL
jgi:hypothetical protein